MLPLYDTIPSRRWPLVNWVLIFLNVVIFLFETSLATPLLNRFISTWGLVPARLFHDPSQAWPTLFSSMFLHGGWFHLFSNMWILFIFGDNVEDRLGHTRYLLFYLLSGLAAGLLQAFLMPLSRTPMVGASGAIAGILGAYMMLFPYSRIVSLVPFFFFVTTVDVPAVIYLGFWFLSQLYSGLFSLGGAAISGIAWWAHIGGFVFGLLSIHLFAPRRPRIVRYYDYF